MPETRFDQSQYHAMKAVFEEVLGRESFAKVKDYGSIKAWRTESKRLLKAVSISLAATVQVYDDEWMAELQSHIQRGISLVESCSELDELFSILAATLARVTFLQIGFLPVGHRNIDRVPLTPSQWKLDPVRSVQYVQNDEQRKTQRRLLSRRKGPELCET
jgi:hypothetical protein